MQDLNAHRNHIQNTPTASHRPCQISVLEHSPEMYNSDPQLAVRGLMHPLCVNLFERFSIQNRLFSLLRFI